MLEYLDLESDILVRCIHLSDVQAAIVQWPTITTLCYEAIGAQVGKFDFLDGPLGMDPSNVSLGVSQRRMIGKAILRLSVRETNLKTIWPISGSLEFRSYASAEWLMVR